MRTALIALLAALACACASVKIPEPRSAGGKLYADKCGACHVPPDPGQHFFQQWQRLMTLIERRIVHAEMQPLSAEERDTLLAYLEKHALKRLEEERDELTLPPSLRPQ